MLVKEAAEVQSYDFRRPNKLNREHIRSLQIVGETFARQFTTVLATTLRTVASATIEDISQRSYDEFIQDLPNPTLLTVLDLSPLKGSSTFSLPTNITMAIIDRLLGGTGNGTVPDRPPTEIEMRLLRGVIERAMRELAYSFESLTPITPHLVRTETNPQFAQVAASTDMMIVIRLAIRVDEERAISWLGIPFNSISPALELATRTNTTDNEGRGHEVRHAMEHNLTQTELEVRVRFDPIQLPSKRIADLQLGEVLTLDHQVDQPLTVEIAGRPRFTATAGTRGKRVACLVTDAIEEVSQS